MSQGSWRALLGRRVVGRVLTTLFLFLLTGVVGLLALGSLYYSAGQGDVFKAFLCLGLLIFFVLEAFSLALENF